MRVVMVALAFVGILAAAGGVHGGEPTEQLKQDIPRVFTALAAPASRQAIRAVSEDLFDWAEMSERMLGDHWVARTDAEREAFTTQVGALVNSHIALLGSYRGAAITWDGESVDGARATVRSRVSPSRGSTVAIDYRLVVRGPRWRVYDVLVDGASLVESYRVQFHHIIRASSYETLVQRLETR